MEDTTTTNQLQTEDKNTITNDVVATENEAPKLVNADGSINVGVVYGNAYEKFKASVKSYLDDLRSVGMGWEQAVSRTYEYALHAIQWHHNVSGGRFTPAHQHKLAAKLLRDATQLEPPIEEPTKSTPVADPTPSQEQ